MEESKTEWFKKIDYATGFQEEQQNLPSLTMNMSERKQKFRQELHQKKNSPNKTFS